MEKSNYALISALYSNEGMGLYKDIYFPIIKYALVKLYSESNQLEVFLGSDNIFNFIENKFGLTIPHVVIEKTIQKLSVDNSRIELEIYEGGTSFIVKNASFDNTDLDIDEKEAAFSAQLKAIDEEYRLFAQTHDSADENVSFTEFITSNTEDVLGYFENKDINEVDDRYTTMIFFLQYLSERKREMYDAANKLFWGSIISGFLKSKRPSVHDVSDSGEVSEYYIDTPIALGLLGLSYQDRETASNDVCKIIKASGGILRINPMTLDEISTIIQKSEQNGANAMTPVADGCNRNNYNLNKLAKIRLNLVSELDKKGVSVLPKMSLHEKNQVINSYKNKSTTKALGERWRGVRFDEDFYEVRNNYREIHDVYMDDFIRNRRNNKSSNQIYFLTSNRDLISFCKEQHEGTSYMMSTRDVILEKWMYNSVATNASRCALAETMANCLDLHNQRVRKQIAEVSSYYNKTKDDFDLEVYKSFIQGLYNRAKKVIIAIDNISKEKEDKENAKIIKDAVEASKKHYDEKLAAMQENIENLSQTIGQTGKELEQSNQDLEKLQEDLTKEKEDKEKAVKENILLKEKDKLNNSINLVKNQLIPLELSRENSFNNWQPKVGMICYIVGGLIVIFFIMFVVYCIYFSNDLPTGVKESKTLIGSLLAFLGATVIPIGRKLSNRDDMSRREEAAHKKWEDNPVNGKYKELKGQLADYKNRLTEVEEELKKFEVQ